MRKHIHRHIVFGYAVGKVQTIKKFRQLQFAMFIIQIRQYVVYNSSEKKNVKSNLIKF